MNSYITENQKRVPAYLLGTTGSIDNTRAASSKSSNDAVSNPTSVSDRKALLQAVYDAHVEQIYKFIFFKVGNREDAEDITSQVFIKAAHSLDVSQESHTQLAWLYQVARTTITDHWRNYYRGVTSSLEAMEEGTPLHLAAEPLYAGAHEDEDIEPAVEKVRAVLALLPENYRRVLELRFLKGCSLRETASAMQVTEANAKVIQHRAIQKALKVGSELI